VVLVRGLASPVASSAGIAGIDRLLGDSDVVHVQNVMNPVALAAALASGRAVVTVQDHRVLCPAIGKTLPDGARCTAVMSDEACRSCLPDREYRDRTLELTCARRDALRGARPVVLSRYLADELAAVGLPGALVIPPWTEVGPEREAAGSHLLLAGRLVRHKGVMDGWQAWRAAAVPVALRVAGAGPLETELEGCVRLGWLDRERLRHELRRARALLFPTLWQEPFGMVGIEALAEGTPVIVARSGGSSEWSDAGCVCVRPGDVEAMASVIRRLVENPEESLTLGREGQAMVRDRYSRSRIEPRLRELYAELAGAS
jgi:glycosyltransferase involved in cell wall biosynthesis